MATHKKTPVFLRVITSEKTVVCINPLQLSSFQILEKAKIKIKGKTPEEVEVIEADQVKFYYPSGTGIVYTVGIDLTQEEFNYVCATLLEFLYLNEAEFKAKSIAIEKFRMEEWNALSKANESKIPAGSEPPKES